MTAHDALCACTLREHSCGNNWAGTHCTKCECHKIARVRADELERHGNNCRGMWDEWLHDLRAQVEAAMPTAREDFGGPFTALEWVLALLEGEDQ